MPSATHVVLDCNSKDIPSVFEVSECVHHVLFLCIEQPQNRTNRVSYCESIATVLFYWIELQVRFGVLTLIALIEICI